MELHSWNRVYTKDGIFYVDVTFMDGGDYYDDVYFMQPEFFTHREADNYLDLITTVTF
ncbi:hypothetical protein V1224_07300 [Lachnospiraceae bacterium JLR.KK008]